MAARGVDIPLLENVINHNLPSKAKLFVHRVGRAARAGRSGTAYSLVSPDELPAMVDLHLFLGKPLMNAQPEDEEPEEDASSSGNVYFGRMPQVSFSSLLGLFYKGRHQFV